MNGYNENLKIRILVLSVMLAGVYATLAGATEAAPDAVTVLNEMAQAYANCNTYEAHCSYDYLNDNGSKKHLSFRIVFRRPSYFWFSCNETIKRSRVYVYADS